MKSSYNFAFLLPSLAAAAVFWAGPTIGQAGEIFITANSHSLQTAGVVAEYTTDGTLVNGSLVQGLSVPEGIAVSGNDLFVSSDGAGTIGEYDATTGATINASLIRNINSAGDIIARNGDLFVAHGSNTSIVSEYTTSGTLVNASFITGLDEAGTMQLVGGDLYVANSFAGKIGEYDATTGAPINASLIAGLPDPGEFVIAGGIMYVSTGGEAIAEYDPNTGALINASFVTGLASGGFELAVAGSDLFVLDVLGNRLEEYTTSGTLVNTNFIDSFPSYAGGMTVVVTPEPATWLLLMIGAVGLLASGFRKR
jgi:hypothetical protein